MQIIIRNNSNYLRYVCSMYMYDYFIDAALKLNNNNNEITYVSVQSLLLHHHSI